MTLRVVGALLALCLATTHAEACSCALQSGAYEEQVAQSLYDAHAVFVARLVRSALKPNLRERNVYEDAQFEVLEVFKGELRRGQIVRVYQAVSGGNCGRSSTNDPVWLLGATKPGMEEVVAKISREWLVFAGTAEPYSLDACTRSAPLNSGGDADVKVLRKLAKGAVKKR